MLFFYFIFFQIVLLMVLKQEMAMWKKFSFVTILTTRLKSTQPAEPLSLPRRF